MTKKLLMFQTNTWKYRAQLLPENNHFCRIEEISIPPKTVLLPTFRMESHHPSPFIINEMSDISICDLPRSLN